MTARFALKAATDDAHRALDDRLSRLDLANRSDYRRFLLFQGRAVPPLEGALAAAGLDALVDGWSACRRTDALASDLKALGDAVPQPAQAPSISGTGDLLGMAYVVEGSRLGGRVLAQQVGAGFPSAFLTADPLYGTWPSLIAVLERGLYSDALLGEAKDAARRCFALFMDVADEAGI